MLRTRLVNASFLASAAAAVLLLALTGCDPCSNPGAATVCTTVCGNLGSCTACCRTKHGSVGPGTPGEACVQGCTTFFNIEESGGFPDCPVCTPEYTFGSPVGPGPDQYRPGCLDDAYDDVFAALPSFWSTAATRTFVCSLTASERVGLLADIEQNQTQIAEVTQEEFSDLLRDVHRAVSDTLEQLGLEGDGAAYTGYVNNLLYGLWWSNYGGPN